MRLLATFFTVIFLFLVAIYCFFLAPNKYTERDVFETITSNGILRVGVKTDSKPFGYYDENNQLVGYDIDLAHYIAQYLLKNPNAVRFVPITAANRMIKLSTDEVDIVIATMTITPQRQEIIDFSIPYDTAGQALLVRANSRITSIGDLVGQNVGVIFGTTAEKNMFNLLPNANIIGFKDYNSACQALKNGKIEALTSDDTILSHYARENENLKLLPKRYSKEPYGIAVKKGNSTLKLREELDFAINDLKQKNVINRLRSKWGL